MSKGKKTILAVVALTAFAVLTGCGSKFAPAFKPEPGEERTVEIIEGGTLSMTIFGQDMSSPMSERFVYTVAAEEILDNGEARLRATYDTVEIESDPAALLGAMGMDPGMLDIDTDIQSKVAEAIEGESYTFKVSPAGEVRDVSGTFDIQQGVRNKVDTKSQQSLDAALELIDDMRVQGLWEGFFFANDVTQKKTGDIWTRRITTQEGEFDLNVDYTFTLKSVEGGEAAIDYIGQISSPPGASMPGAMGMDLDIAVTGTGTGSLTMDAATGWPLTGTSTFEANVDLKMDLSNLPQAQGMDELNSLMPKIAIIGTSSMSSTPK